MDISSISSALLSVTVPIPALWQMPSALKCLTMPSHRMNRLVLGWQNDGELCLS